MIEKESKNIKGGSRIGAGRKKGSPNKKTAILQKAVEESGITPLDFLLQVMRDDEEDKYRRIDAAKAAAQYIHPKLSSVDLSANVSVHESAIDKLA